MPAGSEILAMIKEARAQTPYKRSDCPVCAWILEEHPIKGLHCPLCGWTEFIYQRKTING